MTSFILIFQQPGLPKVAYRVTQFHPDKLYHVYREDHSLIGKIYKDYMKWEQNTGGEMSQKLIDAIGLNIDLNHLGSLALVKKIFDNSDKDS